MQKAPWTQDQCDGLNEYQRSRRFHPFTCGGGNRRDEAHTAYQAKHGGDFGQLIATPEGWVCPACDYRQDWAHDFMFGESIETPATDDWSVSRKQPGWPEVVDPLPDTDD